MNRESNLQCELRVYILFYGWCKCDDSYRIFI